MGRESFEDMKLPPLKKKVVPLSSTQNHNAPQHHSHRKDDETDTSVEIETREEVTIHARAHTNHAPHNHTETEEDEQDDFFSKNRRNQGGKRGENTETDTDNEEESTKRIQNSSQFFDDFMQQDENRGRKYALWGIVFASVIVLGVAALTLWGGASVAVVARREAHPLTTTITAANKSSGASAAALATSIPFQRITITKEAGKKVDATGEEYVERKASGKIVVYNNFSSNSQRLIKNTRFETPDGKIYRIRDSIVIPGKKGAIPGSIEAVVYADEAGQSYNISLTDFTIPGFKTDAGRYKEIYARSKTAMAGGAKGMMKIIDPAELEAVQTALTAELTEQIYKEAESQTPTAFIFFRGSFAPVFEPISQEAGTEQSVLIKQKAYLDAIVFNREILAKALAGQILDNYDGSGISIVDWSTVTGKIENKERNRIADSDVITLSLGGEAIFVATYDIQKIADFLKGQNQSKVKELLTEFPQLESARAVIRPFWKSTFPEDPSKIRVYEDLPESDVQIPSSATKIKPEASASPTPASSPTSSTPQSHTDEVGSNEDDAA